MSLKTLNRKKIPVFGCWWCNVFSKHDLITGIRQTFLSTSKTITSFYLFIYNKVF
jgi:hypothetical protein